MRKWRFLEIVFISSLLSVSGHPQETHLTETGSAPILTRSAFAHGYRHGYEHGYHMGNIDANMGRQAQTKMKLHEGPLGYLPQFGSRKSFQDGFHAGFQAGYLDGFAGNDFRVVGDARALAADLDSPASASADPSGDFDHGLGSGYRDGFARGQSSPSWPATLDFLNVSCSSSRAGTFCEGYRRGFALGRVDALTLRRAYILEASK